MMKILNLILLFFVAGLTMAAGTQEYQISGTVTKKGGGPLEGVTVLLKNKNVSTVTKADGKFELASPVAVTMNAPQTRAMSFTLRSNAVAFSGSAGNLSGNVTILSGTGRCIASTDFSGLNPATEQITLPQLASGFNIVRVTVNSTVFTCRVVRLGNELLLVTRHTSSPTDGDFTLAKRGASAAIDTLVASKDKFKQVIKPIESYSLSAVLIEMDSSVTEEKCTIPPLPAFSAMPEIKELPDPFLMMNGTRMTKKSQWTCRREEIKALAQKCIYGWMPPKPDKMEATYSGGKLTMKCTVGSVTKEFSVTISNNSGTGPFPAIITVAGAVYGVPSGVATINYSSHTTVAQTTVMGRGTAKGKGIFYELYPDYKPSGSLVAWAWGVGRILDALEMEDIRSQAKINPTKIGVTGCSYAGKAAFAIGVFEERIALSLPVECGAGGATAWRIAEEFAPPGKKSQDQNGCQYLFETFDESTWLGDSIDMFRNKEYTLPIDMHEVAALIAPRALLVLGYSTKWICAQGEWGAAVAAQKVYGALGYPDNIGALIGQAGSHCAKASGLNEQTLYNNFVKKFLQDDTSIKTDASVALRKDSGVSFDEKKYIPWTVPTLENDTK
jgi:hypothetical protein